MITVREYYKKIDKSFFNYGITIPREYEEDFLCGVPIEAGANREIIIAWKNKKYAAKLVHVNRSKASNVYQLRWDRNRELLASLKQEFVQSYFAIESQNLLAKEQRKYYVTKLLGGCQEVVIFKIIDCNTIKLETFIRVDTPYENVFKRLIEENVFGWMSNDAYENNLITKSTKWFDISELPKHEEENHVVYYLVDDENKQIYIGSAVRLGDRVKPNRAEIPNWNRFRYEIVHPKFHSLLRSIEYHSIMNFVRFFRNTKNFTSLNLSDYTLVNKDYKFYLK